MPPESSFHPNSQALCRPFGHQVLHSATFVPPSGSCLDADSTLVYSRDIRQRAIDGIVCRRVLEYKSGLPWIPLRDSFFSQAQHHRKRTYLLSTPHSISSPRSLTPLTVLRRRGSSLLFTKTLISFHTNRGRTCLASVPRSPPHRASSPRLTALACRHHYPSARSLSAFLFFLRKLQSPGAAHRARSPPSPLSLIFLAVLWRGDSSFLLTKLRFRSL